jgi:hypothetical protein
VKMPNNSNAAQRMRGTPWGGFLSMVHSQEGRASKFAYNSRSSINSPCV